MIFRTVTHRLPSCGYSESAAEGAFDKEANMNRTCLKHAVAALACAIPLFAAAADEVPPQGALGRALFGDDFGKGSGLVMGGWLEVGYAVNNHGDPGGKGLANSPVVIARDEGIQLNQLSLYLEK